MSTSMPAAGELLSSNALFFPLLGLPGAQARRAKVCGLGCGVRGNFELDFGSCRPRLGQSGGAG